MQLACTGLSYSYPGQNAGHAGKAALQSVSLSVSTGECLAVIGHSGSGKSTLAQLLAGLLKPTAGQVLLEGQVVVDSRHRKSLFQKVSMAFQYPETQLFAPTVADDVAFAARNAGWPSQRVAEAVEAALWQVGLDPKHYQARSPFELSGGEQRRVALAGLLVLDTPFLILDEPVSGLDPAGRRKTLGLIKKLKQNGHGIVLVSHQMEDVAELADQICVLKDGEVLLAGSAAEVFAQGALLHEVNLGVPAAEDFAQRLRQRGLALPPTLLTIDQLADALALTLDPDKRPLRQANQGQAG